MCSLKEPEYLGQDLSKSLCVINTVELNLRIDKEIEATLWGRERQGRTVSRGSFIQSLTTFQRHETNPCPLEPVSLRRGTAFE